MALINGSNNNDTLNGTSASDTINGLDGVDVINGRGGFDTIDPGLGAGTVDGGPGSDVLIVDWSTVNASPMGLQSQTGDPTISSQNYVWNRLTGEILYFSNIERLNFTASGGDDSMQGTGGNDTLTGGGGNDTIDGGLGNDSLLGGVGDDTFTHNIGADTIDGGIGTDTLLLADFSTATASINIDNVTASTIILSNGTTIRNVERFQNVNTGSGNDSLRLVIAGEALLPATERVTNIVDAGGGNDTIDPGQGAGTVDGGAGSDVLIVDWSAVNASAAGLQSQTGDSTLSSQNYVWNRLTSRDLEFQQH